MEPFPLLDSPYAEKNEAEFIKPVCKLYYLLAHKLDTSMFNLDRIKTISIGTLERIHLYVFQGYLIQVKVKPS